MKKPRRITITIAGKTSSGKTTLLHDLAVFLKKKGAKVACIDQGVSRAPVDVGGVSDSVKYDGSEITILTTDELSVSLYMR